MLLKDNCPVCNKQSLVLLLKIPLEYLSDIFSSLLQLGDRGSLQKKGGSYFSGEDPCQSSPCNEGKCIATEDGDSYKCVCRDGFYGENCEKGTYSQIFVDGVSRFYARIINNYSLKSNYIFLKPLFTEIED